MQYNLHCEPLPLGIHTLRLSTYDGGMTMRPKPRRWQTWIQIKSAKFARGWGGGVHAYHYLPSSLYYPAAVSASRPIS